MKAKTVLTFFRMKCLACDWYMNFKGGNYLLMFQACNNGRCSQCGAPTKVVEISAEDYKVEWNGSCK